MGWEWADEWLDGGSMVRSAMLDVQRVAVAKGGSAAIALKEFEVLREWVADKGVKSVLPVRPSGVRHSLASYRRIWGCASIG